MYLELTFLFLQFPNFHNDWHKHLKHHNVNWRHNKFRVLFQSNRVVIVFSRERRSGINYLYIYYIKFHLKEYKKQKFVVPYLRILIKNLSQRNICPLRKHGRHETISVLIFIGVSSKQETHMSSHVASSGHFISRFASSFKAQMV